MTTEKSLLSNDNLFQLSQAELLNISPAVVHFLQETFFPWNALGKKLEKFVLECISKIEPSQRIKGRVSPQAFIDDTEGLVVGEGAIIEAGAYVSGPTFIEPGAIVRHGAYVRGNVYVCKGAVVGHTTEIKGSLLLPLAKAAHFAYVGDSILGVDSNLGAGTKLANLRFDHKNIALRAADELIETGLKKFGAIFGNGAQSGCNSVTNPGTILMPGATILPTANARGIVKSRKS